MKINILAFNGIWESTYNRELINRLLSGYYYIDTHGARRPVDYSIYKNVNFYINDENKYNYYILKITFLKVLKTNEHGHPVQYQHIYYEKIYKYKGGFNHELLNKDLLLWLEKNGFKKDE